jgi:cell fate (sporulation/competence/biofilm development) regulator YlbF (YheA/YmcA/DUF963 family)
MQDNNIAQDMDFFFKLPNNSRADEIIKRLKEIRKKHPEIEVEPGVFDYSRAPPKLQDEIKELFHKINDLHVEEVIWKIGVYYSYLQNNPSKIAVSLAEDLLSELESGIVFIPDEIIKDILNRFPELKEKHPKVQEILNALFITYGAKREFFFPDINNEEVQPLFSEIENLAKAGVKGIIFERKAGHVHIDYEDAHPELKKVLDRIADKITRKLYEIMIKGTAFYYQLMIENPSAINQKHASGVLSIKAEGLPVPDVVVIDALNRFPELRKKYPEIVKEYKKFLK